MATEKKPLVSIVIPTYNSEKTLPLTLASIKRQTYKNIEIIIVDNYSSDRTTKIAKLFGTRLIQVRGERAKAKNIGLRLAKGKYVLFIDSDMILTPRVVEECTQLTESNPRIAGVVIPERSIGDNYWTRVRDFERSFYKGTLVESPRFFRRELALRVGGFDEDLVFYEEATLPAKLEKLGYRVRARIRSPILHYEQGITLSKLIRKRLYYAKTYNIYAKRYPALANSQANPVHRLKLFILNKRFYTQPHLALGVITLKTLEYIASILGAYTAQS